MNGIVTVVQARTGSTRLPGKVLMPLGSGTVLDVMLTRVRASRLAETIVVATTTSAADDPIEVVARRNNVRCFRGHETDLLDRHYRAALSLDATHVVKIPSDCPLIDPGVIDDVLEAYLARRPSVSFASNQLPPTHPDGNDVEIMSMRALEAAWREATQSFEREHTTPFIWNRPDRFPAVNVTWHTGRNCSFTHRVVLDYAADYELIADVYEALAPSRHMFTVEDVVRYLDANPEVLAINAQHRGVHWYGNHLDKLPALLMPALGSQAVSA